MNGVCMSAVAHVLVDGGRLSFVCFSAETCVTAFFVVRAFEHTVGVELLRLVAFGATMVRLLFS